MPRSQDPSQDPERRVVVAEARDYEAMRSAAIEARIQRLSDERPDAVLLEPPATTELRAGLMESVKAGAPTSLIRLGDGEGNVLFWDQHRERWPHLAHDSMARTWRRMFGKHAGTTDTWAQLARGMADAVVNATHLGLPRAGQVRERMEMLRTEPDPDVRGCVGVAAGWDWLAGHDPELPSREQTVVRWHVHLSLLDYFLELVRTAGNLSLITCYPELLEVLHRHCSVSEGEAFLIPPQARNIQHTPSEIHYPDRAMMILDELGRRRLDGQLFFIGAGIAGKAYCEATRRSGGIAIDVGSMLDVWMGRSVRQYQTQTFVQKHRLDERTHDQRTRAS